MCYLKCASRKITKYSPTRYWTLNLVQYLTWNLTGLISGSFPDIETNLVQSLTLNCVNALDHPIRANVSYGSMSEIKPGFCFLSH